MTTVFNAATTPTTARPGDPTLRSAEAISNAPTAARLRRDYGIRSVAHPRHSRDPIGAADQHLRLTHDDSRRLSPSLVMKGSAVRVRASASVLASVSGRAEFTSKSVRTRVTGLAPLLGPAEAEAVRISRCMGPEYLAGSRCALRRRAPALRDSPSRERPRRIDLTHCEWRACDASTTNVRRAPGMSLILGRE